MKKLVIIPILMLLQACGDSNTQQVRSGAKPYQPNKLERLSWLLGTWQQSSAEGTVIETWEKDNDTMLTGASYFITAKGDTPEHETIRLLWKDGLLYYMPTVNHQNNGDEIVFKERVFSDSSISFENPLHDFPKIIYYKKISEDSIDAFVSAGEQVTYKHSDFHYSRKK